MRIRRLGRLSTRHYKGTQATVCTRSAQNATVRVEPVSVNTFCSGMATIARLIGTTERCPFRLRNAPAFSRGVSSLRCLFPKTLLRKRAVSPLRFCVDLGAESRCLETGSSWKYPVEGCSADVCSGSPLSVKSYPSYPRYPLIRLAFACPAPVCYGVFQFRYS